MGPGGRGSGWARGRGVRGGWPEVAQVGSGGLGAGGPRGRAWGPWGRGAVGVGGMAEEARGMAEEARGDGEDPRGWVRGWAIGPGELGVGGPRRRQPSSPAHVGRRSGTLALPRRSQTDLLPGSVGRPARLVPPVRGVELRRQPARLRQPGRQVVPPSASDGRRGGGPLRRCPTDWRRLVPRRCRTDRRGLVPSGGVRPTGGG
jgi:hypothetical protein